VNPDRRLDAILLHPIAGMLVILLLEDLGYMAPGGIPDGPDHGSAESFSRVCRYPTFGRYGSCWAPAAAVDKFFELDDKPQRGPLQRDLRTFATALCWCNQTQRRRSQLLLLRWHTPVITL